LPTPTSLPESITAHVTPNYESDHATAWALINRVFLIQIRTVTTSTTLQMSDCGECVRVNSGSAQTVTLPPDSGVALPVGAYGEIRRVGAGTLTLVAGSGVTIEKETDLPLTLRIQGSSTTWHKTAANTFYVAGGLG
jgi:hypothetical protein